MAVSNLSWNVYYYSINSRKIKVFNIFDHGGFNKEVKEHLQKCETKEEFAQKIKSSLMYFFWSKCEWEVLVTAWVGRRDDQKLKIDVYDQVMNNWDVFVDYTWGFKNGST